MVDRANRGAGRGESLAGRGEGQTAAQLAAGSATDETTRALTLPLLEETLSVSKRRRKTGSVRVSTRTEVHEQLAELALERSAVEITRVAIDRIVEQAPPVRTEGDTTIVPVLEERLVVVKQLVLVEEVHITRRVGQETQRTPVALRRQHAEVARFDAEGRPKS